MSANRLIHRPNILILLVDEERYPPVYEGPAIRAWRQRNMRAQAFLRQHGMEFTNHYASSTGCSPSRATLFTGQYPSLHGVTQTSGGAKRSADSDMFWLDPNTVPTMGDYFRAAGYRTFYKGKWHISDPDIWVPGTHIPLTSYARRTGMPDRQKERLYLRADRLDGYGFTGWIGPEPHGRSPRNSGSSAAVGVNGRDVVYSSDAVMLLQNLEREREQLASEDVYPPWLLVVSFVNPHDITLYGTYSAQSPFFSFPVDKSVPEVAPPPTHTETLATKPRCQSSYRDVYPLAFQPISDDAYYRRLYYQLQKNADQEIMRVLEALTATSFYPDTIVLFTSDHGELLGAHGNLHQKWYCAYEEAIHVPLVIHNRLLFPAASSTAQLTCHADILPTLLGLIGADPLAIQDQLRRSHSDVRDLVGRDLTPLILGNGRPMPSDDPLYFMTDDDVTKGQHQVSIWGQPYPSVASPNRVETVIASISVHGTEQIWKYSRYFRHENVPGRPASSDSDEYELYNLADDPLEVRNLASRAHATPFTEQIRAQMAQLLEEQRRQKRITPV